MTSKISRYIYLFKDGSKSLIFESNLNKLKDLEAEIKTLATFEKNSWKDSPIVLCKGLPYNDEEIFEKKYFKNLNLK